MRISDFEYKGQRRVAVELHPDGNGLLSMQLSPVRGFRTFKPGLMLGCSEVKGLRRLYWWFRYKVGL